MKLTVTHEDAAKGTEYGIIGLGLFENGKAREVTDEQIDAYEAATGFKFKDIGKAAYIEVDGTTKTTGGDK